MATSEEIQFLNGEPTAEYTEIHKCFKDNGNGLLFRLVDEKTKRWHFYNDTPDYVMTVTVEFQDRSTVTPLGKTEDVGAPEGNDKGVILVLEIEPGQTEAFVEGDLSSYRINFSADPVNNIQPVDPSELQYENGQPDESIASADSKVYKCFKNNGNGLLFRLVDETNKVWAFYNDTLDYNMQAIVRFAAGEEYEPCEGTVVNDDPNEPGWKVVTLQIPPVTTLPFIRGLPNNFEVSFAAESVNKAEPEENPAYENGEPDRNVIDYQDVYRCFRDRGNGLLFRLVTADRKSWGFYNDTADTTITARVTFEADSQVTPQGQTTTEEEEEGTAYVLVVPPKTTLAFVTGDLGGFTSKFAAVRKSISE